MGQLAFCRRKKYDGNGLLKISNCSLYVSVTVKFLYSVKDDGDHFE